MNAFGIATLLIVISAGAPRVVVAQAPNSPPPLPWEREGLPCGDYCGKTWSTCRSTPLFVEPRGGSALKEWMPAYQSLEVVRGRMVVEEAGIIVFRDAFQFVDPDAETGRSRANVQTLRFTPRDTVYAFDWESDGDGTAIWHLWFRGQPLSSQQFWEEDFFASEDAKALLVRTPASTPWVEVRRSNGTTGWITVDGSLAGVAPRYTGGPERCMSNR